MPQYDETDKGVLFPEREKKQERSPDYTGKINVNGKDFRLAGWIKSRGVISLAVSEFKDHAQPVNPPRAAAVPDDDLDSEIPW